MKLKARILVPESEPITFEAQSKSQLRYGPEQRLLATAYERNWPIECLCRQLADGTYPRMVARRNSAACRIDLARVCVGDHTPECATQEYYGTPTDAEIVLNPEIFAQAPERRADPPKEPRQTSEDGENRERSDNWTTFPQFCRREFGLAYRAAFIRRQLLANCPNYFPLNQCTTQDILQQVDQAFERPRKTTKGVLTPRECARLRGGVLCFGLVCDEPTGPGGRIFRAYEWCDDVLVRETLLLPPEVYAAAQTPLRQCRGSIPPWWFAVWVRTEDGTIVRLWLQAVYLSRTSMAPIDSNAERQFFVSVENQGHVLYKPYLRDDLQVLVSTLGLPLPDHPAWRKRADLLLFYGFNAWRTPPLICELRGYPRGVRPRYDRDLDRKGDNFRCLEPSYRYSEIDISRIRCKSRRTRISAHRLIEPRVAEKEVVFKAAAEWLAKYEFHADAIGTLPTP